MTNRSKAGGKLSLTEIRQLLSSAYENLGWLSEPLNHSELSTDQLDHLKSSIHNCKLRFDAETGQIEDISEELCLWARSTGLTPLNYVNTYLVPIALKQRSEGIHDQNISYLTVKLPSPFSKSDSIFIKLICQNPNISHETQIIFIGQKSDKATESEHNKQEDYFSSPKSQVFTIAFDNEFRFREIDGAGLSVLGIDPAVLIGLSLEEVLDPDYEHLIRNSIELNKQGLSSHYKYFANKQLIEVASFPVMANGALQSVYTVNFVRPDNWDLQLQSDIRKDTFSILSDLDSSSFLLLNHAGKIDEVNRAFINYLSSEHNICESLYGQTLTAFLDKHGIVPEKDLVSECIRTRLRQSSRRINVETPRGSLKWNMRVQHVPINDESFFFVNITDITANYLEDFEKDQKTMILDAILNNAHLAIMVTDASFKKVLLANPEMHKLTCRDTIEELDSCLLDVWSRPLTNDRRKMYEEMMTELNTKGYFEGNLFGDRSGIYIKRFVQRFSWDGKEWNIVIDTNRNEEVAIRKRNEVYEQRFKAIFNYSSIPTAVYDTETYEFIEVNQAAISQYGYELEETQTMRILDLWPEEQKEKTQALFEKLKKSGEPYKVQVQHQLKSGQVIDVEVNSHPLDFELYGRPARLATAIDISESLKTTLSLIDQKATLRTVLDQIPYPIFLKDQYGKYLLVNQTFINDSNTPENLLIGYSDQEVFANTDVLDVYASTDSAVLKNQKVEYEHTTIIDGTEQHFLTIKRKVELNDHQVCILGISTNITARKKAEILLEDRERLFQDLFKSSPDALFLVNERNGKIIRTNQSALELFEAESEDKFNMPVTDLLPEVASIDQDEEEAIRCKTFKQRYFWGSIAVSSISITGDQYLLIRVIDVSESKNLFNRIEESLKEKDILLREIHHRVKNNLSVIVSLLSLQSAYTSDPVVKENYADSMNRIRSMAILHEELYKNTNLSRIDIRSYVRNLVQQIASTQQLGRHVKVNVSGDEIPLDIIKAVPCGLIFNELITNSFKHAFKATTNPEISIELVLTDAEAKISYRDNGCGKESSKTTARTSSLGSLLISELSKQLKAETHELVINGISQVSGYGFDLKFLI